MKAQPCMSFVVQASCYHSNEDGANTKAKAGVLVKKRDY